MKNIKVYDIKKYIEGMDFDGRKYQVHGIYSGIAIIEGENGVLVIDDEGCGVKKDNTDETYKIGLNDIPEEGVMYALPKYRIEPSINDLMKAEYKEMPITEFIKRYNTKDRIKSNFKIVLDTMNEIGLDSSEYYKVSKGEF